MNVWNNSWYAVELREKVLFSGEVFINKLPLFFKDISYGSDVSEIFYIEECENPIYGSNYRDVLYYNSQKKKIEIGLGLDYHTVLDITNMEFMRYLANKYLERSLDIEDLKIIDFNLEKYIADLEYFFKLNEVI
jgi:hypothetical protein